MQNGVRQLSLTFGGSEGGSERLVETRMEIREPTVRRVEYTPFPRVGSDTRMRVGFTRDVSASGMALGVEEPLPVGSLLRVIVQKVDGRPDFDAVARVAWCQEDPEHAVGTEAAPGRAGAWLGLTVVAEVRRGLARVPNGSSSPMRVLDRAS